MRGLGAAGLPPQPRGESLVEKRPPGRWRGKCGALFDLVSRAEQFCRQVPSQMKSLLCGRQSSLP